MHTAHCTLYTVYCNLDPEHLIERKKVLISYCVQDTMVFNGCSTKLSEWEEKIHFDVYIPSLGHFFGN